MRIISGTARGRQLASFSGDNIRPTPDRVREALFSMLQSRLGSLSGTRVLDLFCGSGALSLEAVSRGAQSAVLVDSGRDAHKTASENIRRCRFEAEVEYLRQDVYRTFPQLVQRSPFDLIFLDPPYQKGHLRQTLEQIESLNLLNKNGIICAESAKGEDPGEYARFVQLDFRVYGSTQIHLFGYPEDCQ